MSRRRNKAAGLAREIANRQRHQSSKLTVVPPLPPVRTPRQYHEAFGPRPEWCDWSGWGYLMPERDGIDIPTGYYRVVDLASVGTFAELRGQVKP
jgi:hypothetical protein